MQRDNLLSDEDLIQGKLDSDQLLVLEQSEAFGLAGLSDADLAQVELNKLDADFQDNTNIVTQAEPVSAEQAEKPAEGLIDGSIAAIKNIPASLAGAASDTYGFGFKTIANDMRQIRKDRELIESGKATLSDVQRMDKERGFYHFVVNFMEWAGVEPESFDRAAKNAFDTADDFYKKKTPIKYGDNFGGDVAKVAAEGLPSLLVGLASTWATKNPVAGSALASSIYSGSQYREGVKAGLTHEEAKDRAVLMSTVDATFGAIGLEGITMPAKTMFGRVLRGYIAEGGEEAAANVTQALIDKYGFDGKVNNQSASQIAYESAATFVGAGLLGGGSSFAHRLISGSEQDAMEAQGFSALWKGEHVEPEIVDHLLKEYPVATRIAMRAGAKKKIAEHQPGGDVEINESEGGDVVESETPTVAEEFSQELDLIEPIIEQPEPVQPDTAQSVEYSDPVKELGAETMAAAEILGENVVAGLVDAYGSDVEELRVQLRFAIKEAEALNPKAVAPVMEQFQAITINPVTNPVQPVQNTHVSKQDDLVSMDAEPFNGNNDGASNETSVGAVRVEKQGVEHGDTAPGSSGVIQPETTSADEKNDLLYKANGQPFSSEKAAKASANGKKRTGKLAGFHIVPVDGGFAIQPTSEKEESTDGLLNQVSQADSGIALEGVSADNVSPVEAVEQTGSSADERSGVNTERNADVTGKRVQSGGSVANDQGEIPSTETGVGVPGQRGGGRTQGKGNTVPDGLAEKRDSDGQLRSGVHGSQPGRSERSEIQDTDVPEKTGSFKIDESGIGAGGPKTKARQNIEAIRIVKEAAKQGRTLTEKEKQELSKYVGWGGIPQVFDDKNQSFAKEREQLKSIVDPDEYEAARQSTLDAHYTAPEIAKAIWNITERLGVPHGAHILEPAAGVGNFIGLAPEGHRKQSKFTAVELDKLTSEILSGLYPEATVHKATAFEKYRSPDDSFDLVIGNPPFGSTKIHDKHNAKISGMSIHNYFFAKSIDKLRPGGIMTAVVSNYLMDAGNSKAREYIAEKADLVGAIRLPNNAFLKNAGTEVTTDILIFRKRKKGEKPSGHDFINVGEFTDAEGNKVSLNEYFIQNPDMMLGKFGQYGTMYRENSAALIADPDIDLETALAEAISKLPESVFGTDKIGVSDTFKDQGMPTSKTDIQALPVGTLLLDGNKIVSIASDLDGIRTKERTKIKPGKEFERAKSLIEIRDTLSNLLNMQINPEASNNEVEALRSALNKQYDQFYKAYGPIHQDAVKRPFADDPALAALLALEKNYQKKITKATAKRTGETPREASAEKADIFFTRTQRPTIEIEMAESAVDTLALSLSMRGGIDQSYMEKLYGKPFAEIAKELGGEIFMDPATGEYQTRERYLSGDVKTKLEQAKEAAKDNKQFKANVVALEKVIPADKTADQIHAPIGSHWIDSDLVVEFAKEVMGIEIKAEYTKSLEQWTIEKGAPFGEAAIKEWSVDNHSPDKMIASAMNLGQISIRETVVNPDGSSSSVVNQEKTIIANEKIEKIRRAWQEWIFAKPERRNQVVDAYNRRMNRWRNVEYSGEHLSLPGKISDDVIQLRPHQLSFVWRVIQQGTALAHHEVGAGKTFAGIAAMMELKRLGRANKPAVIVPNQLVEQWAKDVVTLYPGAKVLTLKKGDLGKDKRGKFFAKAVTGDWDLIIIPHSSFGRIGVSKETLKKYLQEDLETLITELNEIRKKKGKNSLPVKMIESRRKDMKQKLEALSDNEDKKASPLTWEQLGIDALMVDEADEFKNLAFSTSMQGVLGLGNPSGSTKAFDLYIKVRHLMSKTGGKNVVFLTGTPISNSISELYTVMRYLAPDKLEQIGAKTFDGWARLFAEAHSEWEPKATGDYKLTSRLRKFKNMDQLMTIYKSFADIVLQPHLFEQARKAGKRWPIPKVKGGKPQNIVVEASDDIREFIGVEKTDSDGNKYYEEGTLIYRAENLPKRPKKGDDNMLSIMGAAKKAALDYRIIDPTAADHPGSKVNTVVKKVLKIADKWKDKRGTQLIFLDSSTPGGAKAVENAKVRKLMEDAESPDGNIREKAEKELSKYSPDEIEAILADNAFSVYDDIKAKLIDGGLKDSEVAFIHDANTDLQKQELFARVNSGSVRVLIGSTSKMGAGTNVQQRLVALHHIDVPWRPRDLIQREGRILRQGNVFFDENPDGFEVEILRYATKGTLDSMQWSIIESKAASINQLLTNTVSENEIDDLTGGEVSAAEMKAASSGNPLVLQEIKIRQEISKLESLQRDHDKQRWTAQDNIPRLEKENSKLKERLPAIRADSSSASNYLASHKKPVLKADKKLAEGAKAIGEFIIKNAGSKQKMTIGSFELSATVTNKKLTVAFSGESDQLGIEVDLSDSLSAKGVGMRVTNHLKWIAERAERVAERIRKNAAEISRYKDMLAPFSEIAKLERLRIEHAETLEALRGGQETKVGAVQEGAGVYEPGSVSGSTENAGVSVFFSGEETQDTGTRTEFVAVGTTPAPGRIFNWRTAANVIAKTIGKKTQENLVALVVDQDNQPISILRHSIGKHNSSSVSPHTIAAQISAYPNARKVYIAHNHPTGVADASVADKNVHLRLEKALDSLGVEIESFIVTDKQAALYNSEYEEGRFTLDSGLVFDNQVDIVEREIVERRENLFAVTGPGDAIAVVDKVLDGADSDIVIAYLDNQNHAQGLLAVSADPMSEPKIAKKILAKTAEHNAYNYLIYSKGAPGDAAKVAGFLEAHSDIGGAVLDVIERNENGIASSVASRGDMPNYTRPAFSLVRSKPSRSVAEKDLERLAQTSSKELGADIKTVESYRDLPERIRSHMEYQGYDGRLVEGVYDEQTGVVYLVRSNIQSKDRAAQIISHEIVAHKGIDALLGKDKAERLYRQVARDFAGDSRFQRIVKKYGLEGDQLTAAKEFVAKLAETKSKPGAVQRLWAAIRQAFRKIFGLHLTDNDIAALLAKSRANLKLKANPEIVGESVLASLKKAANSLFAKRYHQAKFVIDLARNKRDRAFKFGTEVTEKDLGGILKQLVKPLEKAGLDNLKFRIAKSDAKDHYGKEIMTLGVYTKKGAHVGGVRLYESNEDSNIIYERIFTSSKSSIWPQNAPDWSLGALMYQAILSYAHNNNKVIIPDPAGMSDVNYIRRNLALISSALRHGTTRHFVPYYETYAGLLSSRKDWFFADIGMASQEDMIKYLGTDSLDHADKFARKFDRVQAKVKKLAMEAWKPESEAKTQLDRQKRFLHNLHNLEAATNGLVFYRVPELEKYTIHKTGFLVRESRNKTGDQKEALATSSNQSADLDLLDLSKLPVSPEMGVGRSTALRAIFSKRFAQATGERSVVLSYAGNKKPVQHALAGSGEGDGLDLEHGRAGVDTLSQSPFTNQILYSIRDHAEESIDDILESPEDHTRLKDKIQSLPNAAAGKILPLVHTRYIPDFVPEGEIKSLFNRYMNQFSAMDATRNKHMVEGAELAKRWQKLNRKDPLKMREMTNLLYDATLEGINPFENNTPDDLKAIDKEIRVLKEQAKMRAGEGTKQIVKKIKLLDKKKRRFQHQMAGFKSFNQRFKRLPEPIQGLMRDVSAHYDKQSELTRKALEERIYQAVPSKVAAKALIDELRLEFESNEVQFYFPLKRFGDYWVSVVKPANGDDGKPETIAFRLFESEAAQQKYLDAAKQKWPDHKISHGRKLTAEDDLRNVDPGFVARVTEITDSRGVTLNDEMRDTIWQLYLKTMPDVSGRKQRIHRKKIAGFSNDALLTFANTSFHSAHQLARLIHSPEMEKALDEIRGKRMDPQIVSEKDKNRVDMALNELIERHKWIMNPQGKAWAATATGVGFLFYLGLTPAAAVVNLTQTAIVGLPVLGAKHGFYRATKALLRASTDFATGNLTEQEKQALDQLEEAGAIDRTNSHDLAGIGEQGETYSSKRFQVMEVASWLFHKVERFNREVTALASLRLHGGNPLMHTDNAMDDIYLSHFDYSSANRPRFMHNDIVRVAALFKNYSFNMIYRLSRDFSDSMIGQSKETRRIARKRLIGILAMTGLFGGLKAMPLADVFAAVVDMLVTLFDDDAEKLPEELNTQATAYAHLVDFVGEDAARTIMYGPVSTLTGADMSSRISLNDLLFYSDDREKTARQTVLDYTEQALGAFYGLIPKAAGGIDMMMRGHTERGAESMLPKVVRDIVKSIRYANEGVRKLSGKPVYPDVSRGELLLQSIGFTPIGISDAYFKTNSVTAVSNSIKKKRKILLERLYFDKDKRPVLQDIMEFNASHPGVEITPDNIMRSLKRRSRLPFEPVITDKRQLKLNSIFNQG